MTSAVKSHSTFHEAVMRKLQTCMSVDMAFWSTSPYGAMAAREKHPTAVSIRRADMTARFCSVHRHRKRPRNLDKESVAHTKTYEGR